MSILQFGKLEKMPRVGHRTVVVGNENYFRNIDTANKYYLLGLALADETIKLDGSGIPCMFVVSHKVADGELVDFFVNELESGYKVTDSGYGRATSMSNRNLCMDLFNAGIGASKTGSEDFNVLRRNDKYSGYVRDAIRGYFDGDGWVSGHGSIFEAGICCANKKFLDDMAVYLSENAGMSLRNTQKNKSIWKLKIQSIDAIMFYDYIYYEGMELYLKRKYKFYTNWIKNEEPLVKHR